MSSCIAKLKEPMATLDHIDDLLRPEDDRDEQAVWHDPLRALLSIIHDDSNSLIDIVQVSLRQIREGSLDEELLQKRVTFWRTLLNQINHRLGGLEQDLQGFIQFRADADLHRTQGEGISSERLAGRTRQKLLACLGHIDKYTRSLLSEMQVLHSQRSIEETGSVTKLTELAFVFIPLSFVASLFSMQVHELDGGAPLYSFVLVALGFVLAAYAIRLAIRNVAFKALRDDLFLHIREDSRLQNSEPIPTRTFLLWIGNRVTTSLVQYTRGPMPIGIMLLAIGALSSPIVVLWTRKIDRGFSAAITAVLILLDAALVWAISVIVDPIAHMKMAPEQRKTRQWRPKRRSDPELGAGGGRIAPPLA